MLQKLATAVVLMGLSASAGAYQWIAPTPQVIEIVASEMDKAINSKDMDVVVFVSLLAKTYYEAHLEDPKALAQFRTFTGCVGAKVGGVEALHTIQFARGVEAMSTSGGFETYAESLPPEAKEIGLKIADLHAVAWHCNKLVNDNLTAKR